MDSLEESHKIAGQCMVDNMYLKDCQEGIQENYKKKSCVVLVRT